MIAFPGMLVQPALKAGIKVPDNPEKFDDKKYPHFYVFINFQLGRPIFNSTSHWSNAKIIAKISDDKIKTITLGDIAELGAL